MSDSKQEQILQALVALFATITAGNAHGSSGDTYNYSVGASLRFLDMTAECLNTAADVVYVVSPEKTPIDGGTLTQTLAMCGFKVSMAKAFKPITENPFDPPEEGDRLLMQNRLIQDATAALMTSNRTAPGPLGGLATWIYIREEIRDAQETYDAATPRAIARLRIEVETYYEDAAP